MQLLELEINDAPPSDRAKAQAVLPSLRLERITDPHGPSFAAAYTLLDSFFGPLGELEETSVLQGFVRDPVLPYADGMEGIYALIAAWSGDELVGVRDCYVDIDARRNVCVIALSHSLVVPSWRRSGLAAVMRALPVTLSRQLVQERVGRLLRTLVCAEMEPVDPELPETVVRLLAYGRSGFGVLDPQRFRYSQPDFRLKPGATHNSLPFLGVVRPVELPNDVLPVELASAYPRLFHQCHRLYLPQAQVDLSERYAQRHLALSPDPVALLPLPTDAQTLDRLAPLVRGAVLPLYPEALRGPSPHFGDPGEELAQVKRRWGV